MSASAHETMEICALDTPALLLDRRKVVANVQRLSAHIAALGPQLRPHVKTAKCLEVLRLLHAATPGPITVSTLKEAEVFAAHGYRDILYGVALAPGKLARVLALAERGVHLSIVLDSPTAAQIIASMLDGNAPQLPVLVEIDCDGHRSGLQPDDPAISEIARILAAGPFSVQGVMTHAGESYNCRSVEAIRAMALRERDAVVQAASLLRKAGFTAPVVSVGSTPTATFAENLDGVSEVRAGVFMFFDLVMAGISVCEVQDIALSVLCTVIGHQKEKGWTITDAGWMAMSRDRGTAKQALDQGYGIVCDARGATIPGLIMADANQEHGIISHRSGHRSGDPGKMPELPIGTLLRILPNHACATAAQYDSYRVVDETNRIEATWPRFSGW